MTGSILLMALVILAAFCSVDCGPADSAMTFNGPSQVLKATQVVATLDAPIPKGTNAIWCASFLCSWKVMEQDLTGGPIALEGNPPIVASLNEAPDPRGWLPEGALYTAAGRLDQGIGQTIAKDLKGRFPGKQPPIFPSVPADAFVAYSYLEARASFALPYFQNQKPMAFMDSDGRETPVRSFGIREEDALAYGQLRAQPRVLFRKYGKDPKMEFAIDLCAASSHSQVIVALIRQEPTLAAALTRVEKESQDFAARQSSDQGPAEIQETDVLLVPDLFWQISHHYGEIEEKRLENGPVKGLPLVTAQQDILFRLSRSGAELKSEAKVIVAAEPVCFVLDRPFLIIMRKRDAAAPYFAMWVANAELLQRW
jgi:hypothetical protein